MAMAVNFRQEGIIIGEIVGVVLEIKNLAKILPIKRHLIELIKNGLFSLITIKVEKWVCPRSEENNLGAVDSCQRSGNE